MQSAAPAQAGPLFRGWYVVAAAFVLLFAGFGTAYSFGAFFLPLAQDFAATRAEVSAVFSYAAGLIFLTGAVSGHLSDRYGPRPVVAAGIALVAAGLGGSAAAMTLDRVTLCFTLGIGLGVGCIYVPAIGTVQRWFVQRRGLASGIAVTGIGIGTLLMPLAAGALLRHMDWRGVFVAMAALVLACGAFGLHFLEADPGRRSLTPDGLPLRPGPPPASATDTVLDHLRGAAFVKLYLGQAAMSFAILLPFVHLAPFAEDQGISRGAAVGILGLIGLGSTLGRIFIGNFADRLGRRLSVLWLIVGLAASYLWWAEARTLVDLVVFALWFGTLYGGFIALMPALLADYFAGPRLSSIIGLQYTSAAFGSLLGPIAAGHVFDITGSYRDALHAAAACCVLAAMLLRWTPAPR